MMLIRYIYPPSGKVKITSTGLPGTGLPDVLVKGIQNNRIEIYNSQGELVCLTNDRAKVKRFKLQKGFYLLREMDLKGRVIKSDKIEF